MCKFYQNEVLIVFKIFCPILTSPHILPYIELQDGKTPLQLAVANCYFYVVRHLVEQMAVNVDELSDTGQTALHIACAKDLVEIARYLISVNAALEICDQNGKVPADLCSTPVFKRLLEEAVVRSKGANLVPFQFNEKKLPKDQPLIVRYNSVISATDSSNSAESAIGTLVLEPLKRKTSDLSNTKHLSLNRPLNTRPMSMRPMSLRPISVVNRDSIRGNSINNQTKRITPPSLKAATNNFDLDDFEGENTDPKTLLSIHEVAHVNMNDFEEDESTDIDGIIIDRTNLVVMDPLPLLNAA